MMSEERKERRSFKEEMEVAGSQLVERIKELARESSTRRVIIRNADGEELMSMPLTYGVVAGGVVAVYAPLLAALGALAALVSRVKLEVIREEEPVEDSAQPPETPSQPS